MRYKEIDINIKAIPDAEDEAILNQLIGAKKATVSTDTAEEPAGDNSNNPGKVDSDDPNTKPPMYPLQQELELQKKAAGKDLAQFDNIVQDADQQAEDDNAITPIVHNVDQEQVLLSHRKSFGAAPKRHIDGVSDVAYGSKWPKFTKIPK